MTVGEICNRETVIVQKDTSLLETARLMRSHHVGSIVVVEQGSKPPKPAGIITDRDLVVEVMATSVDLGRVTVGDVMSLELTTAQENDGIWDTIQRMRLKGVRPSPWLISKVGWWAYSAWMTSWISWWMNYPTWSGWSNANREASKIGERCREL